MRYTVTEGFSTLTRRFAAGMEIDAREIDGPVPVDRWVEMGRLKAVEAASEPPSFAAEQTRLRALWTTNRSSGGEREVGDRPVLIEDHALYGVLLASTDDAPAIEVRVPGEAEPRRFPRVAVDFERDTVSGDTVAASAPEPISRFGRRPTMADPVPEPPPVPEPASL